MRRLLPSMAVIVAVLLLAATPAGAFWTARGAGAGTGSTVAGVAAGQQPDPTATDQSVRLTWTQTTFLGAPLGGQAQGGYRVTRTLDGTSTAVPAGGGCAGRRSGSGPGMACTEAVVPYGTWRYTVQPELGSFTGAASAASALVTVRPAAPALTVTARDPAALPATTGTLDLAWSAVPDATRYDVYRRTGTGALALLTSTSSASLTDAPAAGSAYGYVVRAVGGTPAVTSAASAEATATPLVRPASPTAVVATPQAGGKVSVSWTAPAGGATGYDVFRGSTAGFTPVTPLNGATPVTATTFLDTTATDGTTGYYVVRAANAGSTGSVMNAGPGSAASNAAKADATPPAAPSAVAVANGGATLSATTCTLAAGTGFVNAVTAPAAPVTVTVSAFEAGVVADVTATVASTTLTRSVPLTAQTTAAVLDLSGLPDGPVSFAVRTRDPAGNVSAAATAASTPVVKDTVAAVLGTVTYDDRYLNTDRLLFSSECGAVVTAQRTVPSPATFTSPRLMGSAATSLDVGVSALSPYAFTVSATDLAGNPSAAQPVTGSTLL